jgi:hypothetical protein
MRTFVNTRRFVLDDSHVVNDSKLTEQDSQLVQGHAFGNLPNKNPHAPLRRSVLVDGGFSFSSTRELHNAHNNTEKETKQNN